MHGFWFVLLRHTGSGSVARRSPSSARRRIAAGQVQPKRRQMIVRHLGLVVLATRMRAAVGHRGSYQRAAAASHRGQRAPQVPAAQAWPIDAGDGRGWANRRTHTIHSRGAAPSRAHHFGSMSLAVALACRATQCTPTSARHRSLSQRGKSAARHRQTMKFNSSLKRKIFYRLLFAERH